MTPEFEFKVGENTYRATRMSVFDQMHTATEFRDVLIGLAMFKKDKPDEVAKGMTPEAMAKIIDFVMTSGQGVQPTVRERVIHRCFACVTRQSGVGWQAIQTPDGVLVFNDIDLPTMVRIMYAVFEHNKLLDFFSEGPSSSEGGPKTKDAGSGSPTEKTG